MAFEIQTPGVTDAPGNWTPAQHARGTHTQPAARNATRDTRYNPPRGRGIIRRSSTLCQKRTPLRPDKRQHVLHPVLTYDTEASRATPRHAANGDHLEYESSCCSATSFMRSASRISCILALEACRGRGRSVGRDRASRGRPRLPRHCLRRRPAAEGDQAVAAAASTSAFGAAGTHSHTQTPRVKVR